MPMAATAASVASPCSQSAFLFQPIRSSRPRSSLPRPRCHLFPRCSVAPSNCTLSDFSTLASLPASRSGKYDPLLRAGSDRGASGEDGLTEDVTGGGGGVGGEGYGSGGGSGGGGSSGDRKAGGGGASGRGEGKEMGGGMSMSQKITLGYAALVGDEAWICSLSVVGLMGYLKGGSQESLAAGGLSALLLYFVYSQLPIRPAFASSMGLAALLAVLGSRFRKSGKICPAGVVSLLSFIMVGGYAHGILRSLHG